jgi:hypothetical protein
MDDVTIPVVHGDFYLEAVDYPEAMPGDQVEHLMTVLGEVADRRLRQDLHHGGPAHDDTHTPVDYERFISKLPYLLTDCVGEAKPGYRDALIEIAATAVAAAQSWDRLHPLGTEV